MCDLQWSVAVLATLVVSRQQKDGIVNTVNQMPYTKSDWRQVIINGLLMYFQAPCNVHTSLVLWMSIRTVYVLFMETLYRKRLVHETFAVLIFAMTTVCEAHSYT